MYSVLIQNQKTIHRFQEYYPLFLELITKSKVGLCRWVESGCTIDTALPGLTELIEGKEEWRAIIIRIEDENDMSRYKSVPGNIYDFYESRKMVTGENGKKKRPVEESPIPLVRLTQMLGEVPSPELDFEPKVIEEEGKTPKHIFVTKRSTKDDKAYKDLVKKYKFDGKRPDEIILITFVNVDRKQERDTAEESWTVNLEINTSEFCRNNRYSSNVRFLQYPYVNEGRTQRVADSLNFWTCVMLLASNDIDPSTLQAFRLYNIHVDIDKGEIGKCLQDKYDELIGCRVFVEREIRDDIERKMNEKHPLPEYRMDIPVRMEIPDDAEISVNPSEFNIAPRSISNDIDKWEGLSSAAEESLKSIFHRQDRLLDESAMLMRYSSQMPEGGITPLNKYEQLDMNAELSRIFDEILETQNRLSGTRNVDDEEIESLSGSIKELIKCRVTRPVALEVGAGLFLLALILFLPSLAFSNGDRSRYYMGVLICFLVSIGVLCLCEAVQLILHRKKLVSLVEMYNDSLEDNLNVLTSDLGIYSTFISNIVSFLRGKSFLNQLKQKKFDLEMEYDYLQRHLSEINLMIDKVCKWGEANYVPVQTDRNIEGDHVLDIGVRPRFNRLYTLEFNKEYHIPLNQFGNNIVSPFSYVERLVIDREELYEK